MNFDFSPNDQRSIEFVDIFKRFHRQPNLNVPFITLGAKLKIQKF